MTSGTQDSSDDSGLSLAAGDPAAAPRTSSAEWLEGLLGMFEDEGLDVAALMTEAGMDPADRHKPDTRINVDRITVLWEHALARSGKPSLGLDRALAARHSRLGAVSHAMSCSADLGSAMQRLTRYMPVISDATTFTMTPHPQGAWLQIEHIGGRRPVPRQRVEHALLTLLLQCQWLTHADFKPLRMEFVHDRPADDSAHRAAFECELRFEGIANRMLIASADLATVVPTHHADLAALHERLLEEQLSRLGETTTTRQVGAEIQRRLQDGEPRRQDVAEALGLSDRTLQRRLHDEQTSYQSVLDGTRRELAQQLIADRRHSLAEVADLLGFVDVSNFFRAFKRWFGVPPKQYRTRLWETSEG